MSTGKVFLGLLTGVAIGATLGILFAPDKGTKTRSLIAKKSDDYAEELEQQLSKILESMSSKIETVKEDVVQKTANGKAKVDELIGKVL
jgi:gas vesicle protein